MEIQILLEFGKFSHKIMPVFLFFSNLPFLLRKLN